MKWGQQTNSYTLCRSSLYSAKRRVLSLVVTSDPHPTHTQPFAFLFSFNTYYGNQVRILVSVTLGCPKRRFKRGIFLIRSPTSQQEGTIKIFPLAPMPDPLNIPKSKIIYFEFYLTNSFEQQQICSICHSNQCY